jgi:sarcosine oxidase subunit alpha
VTGRRIGGPVGDRSAEPLVRFTFDGREVRGVEGEPLAVALLAAGQPVISRSFRFHRPRGLMCSTGQCGWCECEVDGVPSVRSCRVPVREGLVARGEHAWPSVATDALAALGMVSRWIPPTFYHHRFLRPRRLRKRYLDVVRGFGGRGRLRIGPRPDRPPAPPIRSIETDVLVVGGGRAGLHAAIGAAGAGARVTLVEAERAIGTGWRGDGGFDPVAGTLADLELEARQAGVEVLTGTTAIGWYDGVVTTIAADEHLEISARSLVAATGSYDRVPLVPGADRPGVMAARTAIVLLKWYGVLPGERALLVGSGEELALAGELLAHAGVAELHGPVPTDALVAIRGTNVVAGADVRIGGRRQHIAADVIVFGDRSPNLDLVLAAGAAVERRDETIVPISDANGRTSLPMLFVAGSSAAALSTDEASAAIARSTGKAAAKAALGKRITTRRQTVDGRATAASSPAANAASSPATPIARGAIVCFCEDVRAWEIRAEQAAGYRDPELIKRRTGALTGPCQGKQCLQAFACLTASAGGDDHVSLPTSRPPLRPVRLGDLATVGDDARTRP